MSLSEDADGLARDGPRGAMTGIWIVLPVVMSAPAAAPAPASVGPPEPGATELEPKTTPAVPGEHGLDHDDTAAPAEAPGSTPTYPVVRESLRFDMGDRRSLGLGLGLGALLRGQRLGDPATSTGDRSGDRGGFGELRLRFIGLIETPARRPRLLWFVAPDVRVHFVFGGTAPVAGGSPRGLVGGLGQAGITGGLASEGRAGIYAKGSLMASFLAAGTREGAYAVAPLGLGAGLRIAPRHDVTLMLGPRVDAVLGVQDIAGARRISQIAAGADLAVHAGIGYRAYLALTGSFDTSVLGRAFGGERLNGQGVLDLAFPFKHKDLKLTLFMMYRGQRVTAPPGSRLLPASGVDLASHLMLAGIGVSL